MNAALKQPIGDYTMVDPRRHGAVEPCCVCGSKPQVWRYAQSEDESTVAVCCVNTDMTESDPLTGHECLLYLPPASFYRPRIKDAVDYWNSYQQACRVRRQRLETKA